jgi:hypothetical protein
MLMVRAALLLTLLTWPPQALADDYDEEDLGEPTRIGAGLGVKHDEARGTINPRPTSQGRARELICSYSWPCEQALGVAQCESSMNPRAYSAGNRGWFQIHGPSHAHRVGGTLEALYDPATNTRVAYEIWREQGWRPWPACGRRYR